MLFKGSIATVLSGSLGGITASHTRGGAYFRSRAVPTNPSTARQQVIRGRFATLSSIWGSTLSAVQRAAWSAYAASLKLANSLGDPVNITGQQAFIRTNLVALEAGLSRIDTAPVGEGESEPILPDMSSLILADSASTTPNVLTVPSLSDLENMTSDSADRANFYLSSGPIPSGVTFTGNLPRLFIGTVAGDDSFPVNLSAGQSITADEQYLLRIVRIGPDGRVSPESVRRITATNVV